MVSPDINQYTYFRPNLSPQVYLDVSFPINIPRHACPRGPLSSQPNFFFTLILSPPFHTKEVQQQKPYDVYNVSVPL